jgi:hypothetical protein
MNDDDVLTTIVLGVVPGYTLFCMRQSSDHCSKTLHALSRDVLLALARASCWSSRHGVVTCHWCTLHDRVVQRQRDANV